jgi:hypothetical protein
MKHVNRFPKLCHMHRAMGSTRIVCTNLPNRLGKAVQHFRALCFCDLRLVQGETELLPNRGRKARQPIKRVDKPNQLTRLFRLLRHWIHYMPKLA